MLGTDEPAAEPDAPTPPVPAARRRSWWLILPVIAPSLALVVAVVLFVPIGSGGTWRTPVAAPSTASRSPGPAELPAAPAVGECYPIPKIVGYQTVRPAAHGRTPVSCAAQHLFEIVSVGSFDALPSPPANASTHAVNQALLAACEPQINNFLGGDWRTAWVLPVLYVPPTEEWMAGQHWYACAVAPQADLIDYVGEPRTGSLRDGLRGTRPAAITCVNFDFNADDDPTHVRPADCAQPHHAELAGAYRADAVNWPGYTVQLSELGAPGCQEVDAHYLGFRDWASANNQHVLPFAWWPAQDWWEYGLRDFRCLIAALPWSTTMIGSVKGIKGNAPRH